MLDRRDLLWVCSLVDDVPIFTDIQSGLERDVGSYSNPGFISRTRGNIRLGEIVYVKPDDPNYMQELYDHTTLSYPIFEVEVEYVED